MMQCLLADKSLDESKDRNLYRHVKRSELIRSLRHDMNLWIESLPSSEPNCNEMYKLE